MNLFYASAILMAIAAVSVFARIAIRKRRERIEEEQYEAFVQSMVPFCHCEFDCPCESVLCGAMCDEKKYADDDDFYDEREDENRDF